jgi:hypothetical protein
MLVSEARPASAARMPRAGAAPQTSGAIYGILESGPRAKRASGFFYKITKKLVAFPNLCYSALI